MGVSQPTQNTSVPSLLQIFPNAIGFKQLNKNIENNLNTPAQYMNEHSGNIAQIRTYQIYGNKKYNQAYYSSRMKIKNNPYIFQLIDFQIIPKQPAKHQSLRFNNPASNLCSVSGLQKKCEDQLQQSTLWLFVESSGLCLQDQIYNRSHKKSFDQVQLWSVLSSCVLGAIALLNSGLKQPVLSPKGIGLFQDGTIKVAEWELVSKTNQKSSNEQGEILFRKNGQSISLQESKNSLNKILLDYYWAPEGLKAMENFISFGKKQEKMNSIRQYNQSITKSTKQNFQVFSLGMTLISMCLRNCYYRAETFSQKYLQKLTHQAIQIRKVQGKQLSPRLSYIIQSMVKWDPSQRIKYPQIYNLILEHFNQHPEDIQNSSISLKSFNASNNSSFQKSMLEHNKSRNQSQTSNFSLSQHPIQQAFTFPNSTLFGQGQLNFQNNNIPTNLNRFSNICINSFSNTYDKNQGSGAVLQGNGDYDEHLQLQKQQIFSEDETQKFRVFQGSPISYRTQNSEKNKKQAMVISPEDKNVVCPTTTPNFLPSPLVSKPNLTDLRLEAQISKNPYLETQTTQKFQTLNAVRLNKGSKKNQIQQQKINQIGPQIQKQQINSIPLLQNLTYNQNNLRIDNSINSSMNGSFRGSYRSINKQPPNINSARPSLKRIPQNINATQSARQSLTSNSRILNKTAKIKNQIIFQYRNGPPQFTQPLLPDLEDEISPQLQYQFFQGQLEQQTPDIFCDQFIEQESSQPHFSNNQFPHTSQNMIPNSIIPQQNLFKAISNRNSVVNITSPEIQHNQSKDLISVCQNKSSDDGHFMTFNQKAIEIQQKFNNIQLQQKSIPSKWSKKPLPKRTVSQDFPKKNEECLFTDPKLWEYIKNPIKIQNKSSFESISRFNQANFMQKNSDFSSTLVLKEKQNIYQNQNLFNQQSKQQVKIKENQPYKNSYANRYGQNLQKSGYTNLQQKNFNQRKIVKQKVSKGFYQGQKKNGLRCGYGVFYYNQGGKYKGNWLNNLMHGKGTLQYADGRVAYQGEWQCDQLHGKGILYNQSPNFSNSPLNYKNLDELDQCWVYYEGTFQNDDKSGMGLLMLSNQQQFIGQFKNDMAEGVGQYLRMDGSIIKGIWHKNKLKKILED